MIDSTETETETEIAESERRLAESLSERDRLDVAESAQSVGTLRDTFDPEDLDALPEDEICETSGVLSHVREGDETVGHVLMIEWDDIDDVMRPIRTAERMPGVSVLLRSSPGSYHLYGLSVRPVETQLLDAVRKNGDVWQARWAARRGYFVLRVLPKTRSESGETYKPAPEPVRVFDSESEYPQSRPHRDILLDLAQEHGADDGEGALAEGRASHDWVGDGLRVDHYQTVTDDAKEVLK
jgi:hypothetical protein